MVQDIIEDMEEMGGMFAGGWSTSLSEYDGPIIRTGMSPVGVAMKLADLVAETPDDDLGDGGRVNGVPALLADTPGGDVYVSRSSPHRVLRWVPQLPPGTREPPPATLPSIPDLSDLSDLDSPEGLEDLDLPYDIGGDATGGTDGSGTPTAEDLQEQVDGMAPAGLRQPVAARRGPTQEDDGEPGSTATTAPAELPAMPSFETAVEHIDLEVIPREEVGALYDEIRRDVEELDEAVDAVLVFAEDEMTEWLEEEIAAGEAFAECLPESCHIEADATIVHGRGSEVPTELTFAFTVGGRPAGECTARGVIPASGTGPLGCTNDSPEWVEANRADGEVSATVAEVRAMAITPEAVDTMLADLDRHAAEAARARPGAPGAGGLVEELLSMGADPGAGLAADPAADLDDVELAAAPGEWAGTAGTAQAAGGDEALTAVLDEIGVDPSAWTELLARAARGAKAKLPAVEGAEERADRPVTTADVEILRPVLVELAREEAGSRPLDRIDPESARRVVARALAARTRGELVHAVETLLGAYDVIRRSEQAPGRADSLPDGERAYLDVGGGTLGSGESALDLTSLGLSPDVGRTLDIVHRTTDGRWLALGVWHDPAAARARASAERVQLLGQFEALGDHTGATMWLRSDRGLYEVLEPLEGDGEPAAGDEALTPMGPPTVALEDVVPAEDLDKYARQGQSTYAGVYVGGERFGPIRASDGPDAHSEVRLDNGQIDDAIDAAAAEVAAGRPATVDLVINRTPCSAGDCHALTQDAARRATERGVTLRIIATGAYEGSSYPDGSTTIGWVRTVRDRGGEVLVGLTGEPLRRGGQQLLEAVRNEAASRVAGQSALRTANRLGVAAIVVANELDLRQARALQDAYDAQKRQSPGGRIPRADRGLVNSFTGAQNQLRPQLQRIGVPLNPLPCTCPPCGPTQQQGGAPAVG
jgi:hypothetical protein